LAYEKLNQNDKARETYDKIINQYWESSEYQNARKFKARLGAQLLKIFHSIEGIEFSIPFLFLGYLKINSNMARTINIRNVKSKVNLAKKNFAIVVAEWNEEITESLYDGAVSSLKAMA
jgi:hypothetical protein